MWHRLLKPQKGDPPSRLASLASTNSTALRAHFRQLTAAFLEPFDSFMRPSAPPPGQLSFERSTPFSVLLSVPCSSSCPCSSCSCHSNSESSLRGRAMQGMSHCRQRIPFHCHLLVTQTFWSSWTRSTSSLLPSSSASLTRYRVVSEWCGSLGCCSEMQVALNRVCLAGELYSVLPPIS